MTSGMFEEAMREVARKMVKKEMEESRDREIWRLNDDAREYQRSLEDEGPCGEDCSVGECEMHNDYVSREVNDYLRAGMKRINERYGRL